MVFKGIFGQKENSMEKSDELKTVNIFVGFFFMVNFVLGTGFLGLPFTFFHGGLIAGVCTLLFIAFMTWQTALYELEAMGRAQEVWDYRHSPSSSVDQSLQTAPMYTIKLSRKFEPSELCEIFVGKWLKVVYLIILAIYCFLACLSYSTVTGSAWSVNIPLDFGTVRQCESSNYLHHLLPNNSECLHAYWFCLMLFAVLVIPLSLLDLKEQAIVQFLLGLLRFFTLGAIIVFCLTHILMGELVDLSFDCTSMIPLINESDFFLNETIIPDDALNVTSMMEIVTHFNFSNWVVGVPVIMYAFILHQGIPGLTHPIKEKLWLRGFFNVLFITTTSFYITLGVVGALWFRDVTNETVTLNWGPLTKGDHSLALKILSYYIIFFPSIDVCSVYPLVVHTIVGNIYTVIFGRDTSQDKGWRLFIIQVGMKFVAAILPIALAMVVSNLVYVLKYAGLFGFFIVLLFPTVFQLSSQWQCYRMFGGQQASFTRSDGGSSGTGEGKGDSKQAHSQVSSGRTTPYSGRTTPVSSEQLVDDQYTVQGRGIEEKAPLLGATPRSHRSKSLLLSVTKFFFSLEAQKVSWTPYSTYLNHPLIVIFIACFAVSTFVLACVSLAQHPKQTHC